MLHTRKYTDSRVLADFFTREHGRISGVLRLGKRKGGNPQPFQSLQILWRGTHELKTIVTCEPSGDLCVSLVEKQLYCGFYLNEMLQRLVPLDDPFENLFACYEKTLASLSKCSPSDSVEPILREFEFYLLEELGFAINFSECLVTGSRFTETNQYFYRVGEGFYSMNEVAPAKSTLVVSGADLLAIATHDYRNSSVLAVAKKIARTALRLKLGEKPIKSRELFY